MTPFQKRNVGRARQTGDIIRTLREEQRWSRKELAEFSGVDERHIISLEEKKLHLLPSRTYAVNFVRAIANTFNVNAEKLIADFEKEYNRYPFKQHILPPSAMRTEGGALHPRTLRAAIIIGIVLLGIVYLFIEISGIISPPELQIFSPQDNIEISEPYVLITGTTQKGASVTVNNEPIDVDESGNFSAEIDLTPGVNVLKITTTHKFGRQRTVERNIFVQRNTLP